MFSLRRQSLVFGKRYTVLLYHVKSNLNLWMVKVELDTAHQACSAAFLEGPDLK